MDIKQTITLMDNWLEDNYPQVIAEKIDGDDVGGGAYVQTAHLKWMIGEMRTMTDAEKLMRCLGFMQGALWSLGFSSIDNFREMNTKELD